MKGAISKCRACQAVLLMGLTFSIFDSFGARRSSFSQHDGSQVARHASQTIRRVKETMIKLKMSPRKRHKRTRSSSSLPPPPSSMASWVSDDDGSDDVVMAPPPSQQPTHHHSNGEKDKLADNIAALLAQEESNSYASVDYLSMTAWHTNMSQLMNKTPNTGDASRIDEYCREQICEWSYRVVDYFRIDREVVSVSLSYLDRFLGTCGCDRSMFKLAATTTLYMAVKVFHPSKLEDLGVLSDLSRGEFDMKDVAEMEQHILRALSWRLHPPTAVALAALTLEYSLAGDGLLHVSDEDVHEIKDTASFFAELAVCDYFFTTLAPSTVALASILNSLEGVLSYENDVTIQVLEQMRSLDFPMNRQQVTAARNRLWELYERSEECALHMHAVVEEEGKSGMGVGGASNGAAVCKKSASMQTLSPVSVNGLHSDSFPSASSHVHTLKNGSW